MNELHSQPDGRARSIAQRSSPMLIALGKELISTILDSCECGKVPVSLVRKDRKTAGITRERDRERDLETEQGRGE